MPRKLPALAVAVLSLIVTAEASAAGYATRTLKHGSSGSDVRAFQRYLDTAGFDTTADGAVRAATRRSVMAFESAEDRTASTVRRRAASSAWPAPTRQPRRAGTTAVSRCADAREGLRRHDGLAVAPSSAPAEVQAIIAAGQPIATKPYKYGGGHSRWNDTGYDCSGSVSYVLHAAGLLDRALDSSGFMS